MAAPKQIFIVSIAMIVMILIILVITQPSGSTTAQKTASSVPTTVFVYGRNSTSTVVTSTSVSTTSIRQIIIAPSPPPVGLYILSGDVVQFYNVTTGRERGAVSYPGLVPSAMALSPGYGVLFLANGSTGTLLGINTSNYGVQWPTTAGMPTSITTSLGYVLTASSLGPQVYQFGSTLKLEAVYNMSSVGDDAVGPAGLGTIYATNPTANSVTIINVASGDMTTEPVGKDPTALAMTPNGRYVLVVNTGSSTVSVINTSLNTVAKTISLPSGSAPVNITISPNGNYAYIADSGTSSISTITMSSLSLNANSVSVGFSPAFIALDPTGSYLYVASPASNTVYIFTVAGVGLSLMKELSIPPTRALAVS